MALQKIKAIKPYLYEKDFNVLDKRVISGLISALISPIFCSKEEIDIVFRFLDKEIKTNYLKNYSPRLKFLNTKIYDLENENLDTLEFFIISTKQYSACLIFDFSLSDVKNKAVFCSYFNSKKIDEILKILLSNEKFLPERRENIELNEAFLNLIKYSENSLIELNINEKEKKNLEDLTQTLKRDEIIAQRARFISHEIKNQLSIIDVYTKITEKTCENNPKIMDASRAIYKSIKNITNLLKDLKSFSDADLNVYNLKEVISETIEFVKEMAKLNNISLKASLSDDFTVVLDKEKFQNVLLNLIKNAIEALSETEKANKFIEIALKEEKDNISLTIANNGSKIEKKLQTQIFEEGFTTKKDGSGLGLYICKQTLKEQFCELSLIKSSSALTVFEIKMKKL